MSSVNKNFALICFVLFSILTALTIPGCGGGGGNSDTNGFTLTKTPIQAQIQLPAGTPITDLTTLDPWSSGGATTPNPSGQSNVTIFNDGPQYSDVRDSQGRLVLVSFLSSTNKLFNAETTAVALIFFAMGGAAQIDKGPETILAGIRELSGFDNVVAEITDQLVTNGYISVETGSLGAEIQAIVDALGPPTLSSRGTIAEPTNATGIILNTITDGQFTIQNNHLRRSRAWLRRISYVGADRIPQESVSEYKKFDIAVPSRYGGFTGTVVGIFKGELTWQPTISEPIPIPRFPVDAISTTYELKTFGLGLSQGNLQNLTPEEENELISVSFKSIILDAVLPVIANIVLPLKSGGIEEFVKFANGSAIVSDLINVARETVPQVYDKLKVGELKDAIKLIWDSGFTTNSMLPAILQLAIDFGEKYGSDAFFDSSGDLAEGINKRLALLGAVDVFFSFFDSGVFAYDFYNSDRSNIFTITTTGGKIGLTVDDPIVSSFDTTLVRAIVQNKNPDALYKYEWSVSDGYKLTTSNGNTSDAPNGILASNDDFARISTETDEPGVAVAKCRVTRIDGEPDEPIDEKSITVEFVPNPTITPASATIAINETVDFHAEYEGPYTPTWKYTLESPSLGTINRTSVGSNPDCTFTAGTVTGTATLKIDMYLTKGTTTSRAYTTTRTVTIGIANRVFPFTFNDWGTNGSELFWGRATTYINISKTLGSGTYTLYRNGTPFRSWSSDGNPPATQFFPQIHEPSSTLWAVEIETRYQDTFESPIDAENYGRNEKTNLQSLYHNTTTNVFTISVTPTPPN